MPEFIRRRLSDLMGLGNLGLAAFGLLALLTYTTADPSWNTSSTRIVQNAAGAPGAYVADALLQIVGLAGMFVILSLTVWGVLILTKNRLKRAWLRFTFLLIAIPMWSAVFAALPAPASWPVTSGLGGFIGAFLRQSFYALLSPVGYVLAFLVTAIIASAFTLGLTPYQWRRIIAAMVDGVMWVASNIALGARVLFEREATPLPEPDKRALRKRKIVAMEEEDDFPQKPLRRTPKPPAARTEPSVSVVKSAPKQIQTTLKLGRNVVGFELPPLALLAAPGKKDKRGPVSEGSLAQNARMLESVLEDFGVNGKISKIRPGPVVTLYELEPSPGTKSSRVIALADDIARSMSAISARIAVIPGKNAIGIELPNSTRETVFLRELLESPEYNNAEAKLALVLGKDIGGDASVVDLAKMPHLLVAGTTGSGKSVGINAMILSLVYRLTPEQCKFIMIDPKMLELSIYDGIPHLLAPVVTEPGKAVVALKWTVKEMENRYRLMSTLGVRNIIGYNQRIQEAVDRGERITRSVQTGFDPDTGKPIIEEVPLDMTPLPYIVVIVDEMADLMLVAGKDIETSIQRLAQMARAAGIHLIMATQRPSVDVITGVIKANFPTRISFQVTSKIDSRTILGEMGAEQLLGMGDMLYMAGGGRISRVHGPFVADKEVEAIVQYLREQGTPQYVEDVTRADDEEGGEFGGDEEGDEADLYRQAVEVVVREGKASTSYIQRRLKIGYNRAANLIERMEQEGIVSPANHVGKREVLSRG